VSRRRFDPSSLVAGLLFLTIAGRYLVEGFVPLGDAVRARRRRLDRHPARDLPLPPPRAMSRNGGHFGLPLRYPNGVT
jgi:hypothetical protein